MWIMVAGPYTTGAKDAAARAANLRVMNTAAWALHRQGHVPIIGVNMALPIVEVAGDEAFDEIMMPLSLALADRCDACLRIGGADEEMARFQASGRPVYRSLEDVPPAD